MSARTRLLVKCLLALAFSSAETAPRQPPEPLVSSCRPAQLFWQGTKVAQVVNVALFSAYVALEVGPCAVI